LCVIKKPREWGG